jgi:hypothetical protein
MAAAAPLEGSYDHLVDQEVVRDVVRLLQLDRGPSGTTSLVLSLRAPAAPSLLDLEGLGKEIWADEDAQAYVSRLRDEWNR